MKLKLIFSKNSRNIKISSSDLQSTKVARSIYIINYNLFKLKMWKSIRLKGMNVLNLFKKFLIY